ncbi:MAG: hypothetical protein ACI8XO_004897 [Verrucomicrobiales bacterium]|jgi:uncharacterized protein (DUF1499 family)
MPMLANPKFWLLSLVAIGLILFLALLALSFTAKQPARPESISQLLPCPDSPNCVCSEETRSSHVIAPLAYAGEATVAWSRLKSVLAELGATEVRADDSYLWFEFRTSIFRFTDDVECRLNQDAQQIEIRSASRVGRSDLGANKKRVEAIRAAFAEAK